LARIDETLRMTREVAESWNNQMPGQIRSYLEQRRAKLLRDRDVSLGYPQASVHAQAPQNPVRAAAHPEATKNPRRSSVTGPRSATAVTGHYDLFLSHASEDKDTIARPLYEALTSRGVTVWFDEAVLQLGDSLRRKIDEGLRVSRFGLVILSPN